MILMAILFILLVLIKVLMINNFFKKNILDLKHGYDENEIINLSFTTFGNYNSCPLKYKLSHELEV